MTDVPLVYALPAGGDPAGIVDAVATRLGISAPEPSIEQRTYLDTFDWRLYAQGLTLHAVPRDATDQPPGDGVEPDPTDAIRLVVEPRPGRRGVVRTASAERLPKTTADLAPGWFADALDSAAGGRLLTEAASAPVQVWTIEKRNGDDKLMARLVVESAPAGSIARVIGVRGYDRGRNELAQLLATATTDAGGDWAISDHALIDLLQPSAGRDPASPDVPLDPKMPAALGYVKVLQRLVDVLAATESGTREGLDTEFLHDYRVAVRRTRSALRHSRRVLPKELLDCFRSEFSWLQEVTGPVRDLDVYLEEFADDRAGLPPERAADLDVVADALTERRTVAQHQLVADLASARATALFADWHETLGALARTDPHRGDEADEWGPWPKEAAAPMALVAAERIVAQYESLVADGRKIRPHSRPEALHDLRKAGKELRYLFELFGSALPRETVTSIVKDLKGLQDCLGRFQDTQIQQGLLMDLGESLAAEGRGAPGTLLALGGLVDRLEHRRADARAEFHDRFAAFAGDAVGKRIRALARSGKAST